MAKKKSDYSPISLGEYADGSEEWLGARAHGKYYDNPLHPEYIPVTITGSEASGIENDNTFKTKEELYAEKMGIKVKMERPKNQAILDAGHELEQFVANMFVKYMYVEEKITDIEVWQDTNMYQHPHYPFALANIDRRIKVNGIPGILECKTTGSYSDIELWKAGIVPKKYEWQVRHYLGVLNLPYAYIVCCWGFTLKETAVIKITRDLAVEQMLFEDEQEFVEICEYGEDFINTETKNAELLSNFYLRLYGTTMDNDCAPIELPHTEEIEELMDDARTLFERKKKLEAQLAILEEENFAVAAKILQLAKGKTNYATYRIDDDMVMRMKLHIPSTKVGFNEELLKKEDPATYQKYCTLFDAKTYKKENKVEAQKYVIPSQAKSNEAPYLKEIKVENIPVAT